MQFYNKTLLFLSILLITPWVDANPVLIDQVVASVDGSPILDSELEKEKANVAQMLKLEKREGEMDQPIAFKKRVLEQMIEDILIEKEIARLGLEANDSQVEQVIQNIMSDNNIRSKEDFKKLLQREGLTFEEFENNYRKRISRNNYIRQNIQPKITITDDEVQKLITQADPNRNMKKKFFEFAMLFVPTSTMTEAEFLDIAQKVQSGESFEKVAKKHTMGPKKEEGGYMGKVNEDDLHKKIRETLTNMKNDQISSVISMENGRALVKKIDEGIQLESLSEEEKAKYTDQLFNQRVADALTQNINRLRQNALIEIFL